MDELYSEGKLANREAAEEILIRLEKYNNYIPASARHEYRSIILKEYKEYLSMRNK